jgi:hypothetical protein
MARDIDTSDLSKLDEAEVLYLHARNRLTDEQVEELGFDPKRAVLTDPPPAFQVHTGDANTSGVTQADIDKATQEDGDDSLEPKKENLTEPQLQGFDPDAKENKPAEFTDDAVVNENDSYYNWETAQLNEELRVRGLSTNGSDKQKAARLEKDDERQAAEEDSEEA